MSEKEKKGIRWYYIVGLIAFFFIVAGYFWNSGFNGGFESGYDLGYNQSIIDWQEYYFNLGINATIEWTKNNCVERLCENNSCREDTLDAEIYCYGLIGGNKDEFME